MLAHGYRKGDERLSLAQFGLSELYYKSNNKHLANLVTIFQRSKLFALTDSYIFTDICNVLKIRLNKISYLKKAF